MAQNPFAPFLPFRNEVLRGSIPVTLSPETPPLLGANLRGRLGSKVFPKPGLPFVEVSGVTYLANRSWAKIRRFGDIKIRVIFRPHLPTPISQTLQNPGEKEEYLS